MYRIIVALLLSTLTLSAAAQEEDVVTELYSTLSTLAAQEEDVLRVGIKESVPLAVKDGNYWKGASVNIAEGVSRDLERELQFIEYQTVGELITAVETGDVDMSISAITITADREGTVDFSYPYWTTRLGVLTRSNTSFLEIAITIGTKVGLIFIGFILLLYVVGWLVNKVDGSGTIHNWHEGAWWSLVTFSTVGYGDLVPETTRGKVFAATWIVMSLFLISLFTGYVSSSMTVKRLSDNPTTLADLHRATVITIAGTTGEKFLEDADVQHFTAKSFDEAMALVHQEKADAFVYDETMLATAIKGDVFEVWPLGSKSEHYGIALPEGSELIEDVNVSILRQTQN